MEAHGGTIASLQPPLARFDERAALFRSSSLSHSSSRACTLFQFERKYCFADVDFHTVGDSVR